MPGKNFVTRKKGSFCVKIILTSYKKALQVFGYAPPLRNYVKIGLHTHSNVVYVPTRYRAVNSDSQHYTTFLGINVLYYSIRIGKLNIPGGCK